MRILRNAINWRRHVVGKCGHGLHADRRRHERHGLRKGVRVHRLLRLSPSLWLTRKCWVYVGNMRPIRRDVRLRRRICAVLLLRSSASCVVVTSSRASPATMRIATAFTTLCLPSSTRSASPSSSVPPPSTGTTSLTCICWLRVVRRGLRRRRRWGRELECHWYLCDGFPVPSPSLTYTAILFLNWKKCTAREDKTSGRAFRKVLSISSQYLTSAVWKSSIRRHAGQHLSLRKPAACPGSTLYLSLRIHVA